MNYLYFDIETIPAQSPEAHAAIAENVKPPAAMKKAETIAAWEQNDRAQAVQDAIAKTSLDGVYGHICCIGFALNDMQPDTTYLDSYSATGEATILRDFFTAVDDLGRGNNAPICIVGHNVVNFDIRFIWQRAIILGVRVPHWFPRDPKPWGNDAFDTMTAFAGQRGTISMDRLCQALGMDGKSDVDGSMVGQMWAEGRHQEIAQYCRDDVERTRAIHKRMAVAFGEAA
ncbi:3'-5' exonuclease family protein [Aquamicrobium zhengzhouense]|uniref:Ribonuclease H n=1 Tax=Aquamicrobium zhengzhouense TaxID=2781738 RepID=A0ABS0SC26_9HYPH|nr:hypothetical protein [Aquamicrobium zhengzhouense]MBI1620319.1 ribonuclease H [Aquamicrobium zhengzhouense]